MSENLENQNVQLIENTEPVQNEPVKSAQNSEAVQSEPVTENVQAETTIEEENHNNGEAEMFIEMIKNIAQKRDEIQNELIQRRDYLNKIVPQYETYFQNESFKNLYSELFNHIGAKLDMETFIPLLDKYVEARIEDNTRQSLAKKENDRATDGISFEKGENKKTEKTLKMQDIPVDQLEKYIAKYV